ncbi:MAG: alpha-amylase [Candidatus Altiarchaeales archaeon]|nr:MAG: alpha-amylase [Candidatus Altiarchaeales archaeon]
MVSVCFYFQVHQPFRLRKYQVFEVGHGNNYFDDEKNKAICQKVARKCYLPTNRLILDLIKETNSEFRVAFSITGTALEQFELWCPEVIESFQELVATEAVELLDETYYHSLAFLFSEREFKEQVKMHRRKMLELFDYKPRVFRNTELIYNNALAALVEDMGYKGVLAEGADHILGWRSPNFVYRPVNCKKIKLLLKNYRLSDDIAFRFSCRDWVGWPLTAEKFASWISAINGNGVVVNLFMDYETFGEHQWAETGIFEFLRHLPREILKHPDNNFLTPSEVIETYDAVDEIDVPHIISWADVERDLTAWLGNKMQQCAIEKLYELELDVKRTKDEKILEDWRKLQTADHFYYMCTKWFNDGDVHKYFNAFDRPHDAFISFINVLNDLRIRVKEINESKKQRAYSILGAR